MPEYLSPGVYIEEINSGPRPIEGVGTACAAFVGFAPWGPVREPVLVTNWSQFVEQFGAVDASGRRNPYYPDAYLAHSVAGYFANGGGRCYVVRVPLPEEKSDYSVQFFSDKEKKPLLTVQAKARPMSDIRVKLEEEKDQHGNITLALKASTHANGKGGLEEKFTGLTLRSANGRKPVEGVNNVSRLVTVTDHSSEETVSLRLKFDDGTPQEPPKAVATIQGHPLEPLKKMATRLAARALPAAQPLPQEGDAAAPLAGAKGRKDSAPQPPMPAELLKSESFFGDVTERTGIKGMTICEDVTMLCVPDLLAAYEAMAFSGEDEKAKDMVNAVQKEMVNHCDLMGDRMAILDPLPGMKPLEMKNWTNAAGYDSKFATIYYPWVCVMDPNADKKMAVPPSGHMAGVYARSDRERGVHKAPANEVVSGVIEVERQITKGEQEILNPIGVNCIRTFSGRGIRVWGARTLSSDPAWRYINVRRLFNYVEKSIERGTQWVVFEPNDPDLWARVTRDVTAFLKGVADSGALFGSAQQAFFVRCDESLNTEDVRNRGQLIIEVGLAPVKPAEFVIFRLSQFSGGGE
jgi:hypothetical protein